MGFFAKLGRWRPGAGPQHRVAATPAPPGRDPGDRSGLLAHWRAEGHVVLPGFYAPQALDAIDAGVQAAWARRVPRIVVDDLVTGQRLRLADVSESDRLAHRFKTNDLYLEDAGVRGLALNARITPLLRALLGQGPVLCNSLNFQQGSAQAEHVDTLYMTPRTPDHLIAIWVALEDVHPDAGPLFFLPGSHRIPALTFSNGSRHGVPAEMDDWSARMAAEVAARGLRRETFLARKGDVFVWHAHLLHGGSPIRDPQRSRKSVVFHYLSEPDCRAAGAELIPQAGGHWLYRAHQPVPGAAAAEWPERPDRPKDQARAL